MPSRSTTTPARGASDATILASVIEAIGEPRFPEALLEAIHSVCSFDSALVVLYAAHRRPDILIDRLSHARRENTAERYIAGAYLLDPFYIHAKKAKQPKLLRMRDIAPKDFDTSDYFVSYYKQSAVVDELNYVVPLKDGRTFAISFERSSLLSPFSECERERCAALLPVIAAAVNKHVAMPEVVLPANAADREHERLVAILRSFGANVLTPRECHVVELMLNGHSANAIANLLEVSVETVRVHRRNIYEKLNISSLAELFSLALKSIYSGKPL